VCAHWQVASCTINSVCAIQVNFFVGLCCVFVATRYVLIVVCMQVTIDELRVACGYRWKSNFCRGYGYVLDVHL
jgi:hypothetical protein